MDDSCLSCDVGKTAFLEGATSCDACAAGSYAPNKVYLQINRDILTHFCYIYSKEIIFVSALITIKLDGDKLHFL